MSQHEIKRWVDCEELYSSIKSKLKKGESNLQMVSLIRSSSWRDEEQFVKLELSEGLVRTSDQSYVQPGKFYPPPNLLSIICKRNFQQLTILRLMGCYIRSIDPLAYLNAPNIEIIDLDKNEITSLKPLAKMKFNKIKDLTLSTNYFKFHQMTHLCRTDIKTQQYSLYLEIDVWDQVPLEVVQIRNEKHKIIYYHPGLFLNFYKLKLLTKLSANEFSFISFMQDQFDCSQFMRKKLGQRFGDNALFA